jgi:sugar phosphate isomerase/epimerase
VTSEIDFENHSKFVSAVFSIGGCLRFQAFSLAKPWRTGHIFSMNRVNRRGFVRRIAFASVAAGAGIAQASATQNSNSKTRAMTICLVCGNIGVTADQLQAIELAHRYGFESVEAYGNYLAGLSDGQRADLLASMKSKGIVFGAAGLPVDFRQDERRFEEGLKSLPRIAEGLERAGVDRVGTWISPGHDSLTYLQNLKQHASRLRQVAEILRGHKQRLGLEYVGTLNSRTRRKYQFVHTLAETRELIVEIGLPNVGLVLDSWHWWTAGDTEEDLRSLSAGEVVAVDLNDAPSGIPRPEQIDNRRELPAATGVIDLGTFLKTLRRIGYDGPVRAEPFNKKLNDLDNDEACAATAAAMKKAFALLD